MPVIGLTGGFAVGKSAVASMFVDLGAKLVDLDLIARQVVEPGAKGLDMVVKEFGERVLSKDGTLNRNALGDIVFNDPNRRLKLESILHPLIIDLALKKVDEITERAPDAVIIVDAALLFESGMDDKMDGSILVTCSEEKQIERGMKRNGLTADQVKRRVASQWTAGRKAKLADWVIDNSGSVENTRLQTTRIWDEISNKRG